MGRTVGGHGAPKGEPPQSRQEPRQGPLPAPHLSLLLGKAGLQEASLPDAPVNLPHPGTSCSMEVGRDPSRCFLWREACLREDDNSHLRWGTA